MKKIKAYVVNHGHMDIEWYQPLTTFSEWFKESIEQLDEIVKNEPDYKCYTYDGVVFPILYIMERDSSLAEKVKRLIADGKLKIGPFYTQFDEFLPSGENIIKNCLWGDRKCRELNTEAMKAGYLLDNFGHPAQLPQVLNNFNIKSLFFSRGMCEVGDNVKEFVFRAPDGSELAAQSFSYSASFKIYENNHSRPGMPNYLPYYNEGFRPQEYLTYEYLTDLSKHVDHEGIARQLIDGVKANAHFYPSGIVPLFVGADHCPPQEGLAKTLAIANEMQDEIEFIFTDAEELSNELNKVSEKFDVHSGLLLGAVYDRLFLGAMTTRAYLKRMMYDGEHLLFDYARPLAAYNKLLGGEAFESEIDEATKLLLINSTHDSIHGSSLDSVHKENEYRFDRAAQLSARAIHNSLKNIARSLDSKEGYEEFVVFSPRDYDGYVSAWLLIYDKDIELVDGDGNIYETTVAPFKEMLYNAKGEPYYRPVVGSPGGEVIFKASFKAGEVKKFYYRLLDKEICKPSLANVSSIENEFYSLSIKDGELVLSDKESKVTMYDFLRFTEEAEAGDSFDHKEPWLDTATYSSDEFGYTDVKAVVCGLYEQLTAKCTMRVPLETVGDVRSESLVDMPILLTFKLWRGIKRLDISIKISNYSKNHRVRAEFSFPNSFDSVKAGEMFCIEKFSVERPQKKDWWKEPYTEELPFRDFLSVSDGELGYTVAAKGLYTFEPLSDRKIAITLFRGIGELMRTNVRGRASCCAAGVPVEDAQCLREMTFDMSLFTHSPEDSNYEIEKKVESFVYPPAVHPIRRNDGVKSDVSSFEAYRFIDNSSLVVSLFDLSYDREYYVLRFYEINGESTDARIDLSHFSAVYLSDMNENIHKELPMKEGVVELDVPQNKIVTLLMKR